jgi:hypothetical protein
MRQAPWPDTRLEIVLRQQPLSGLWERFQILHGQLRETMVAWTSESEEGFQLPDRVGEACSEIFATSASIVEYLEGSDVFRGRGGFDKTSIEARIDSGRFPGGIGFRDHVITTAIGSALACGLWTQLPGFLADKVGVFFPLTNVLPLPIRVQHEVSWQFHGGAAGHLEHLSSGNWPTAPHEFLLGMFDKTAGEMAPEAKTADSPLEGNERGSDTLDPDLAVLMELNKANQAHYLARCASSAATRALGLNLARVITRVAFLKAANAENEWMIWTPMWMYASFFGLMEIEQRASVGEAPSVTPDGTGRTVSDARDFLKQAGYQVFAFKSSDGSSTAGQNWYVVGQEPMPGAAIDASAVVTLIASPPYAHA